MLPTTQPAEGNTQPEESSDVATTAPATPAPLPDQGSTSGSVPDTAVPLPEPQPTPDPKPEPEPEPELPVFDSTLLPGSATCNTSQNGVAGTFLYGFATRSLQSAQIRATQGSSGQPVLLPEGAVERWGHLWMTASITPLSQWPGLSDTPSLTDPANPAMLEIQVTDLNGNISEWTRLDLGTCGPTP